MSKSLPPQLHCPGCFEPKQGLEVCAACGYDESAPRDPRFLPHGTLLKGQYRIGRVLAKPGGFGITYLSWDSILQQKVAVKEYMPRDLAHRDASTQSVSAADPDHEQLYRDSLAKFLREARVLAGLNHPNIVRVLNFFHDLGTAYMIMPYYQGRVLSDVLRQGALEPAAALEIMFPVLHGLQYIHSCGLLHRDIKPANIYLLNGQTPMLLDFGAARQVVGAAATVSAIYTEHYSPLEQYQRSYQGPWTDVYAVAATLYRAVSGRIPPTALDRLTGDTLEQEGFAGAPTAWRGVLSRAMAVQVFDRYQSVDAFAAALKQPEREPWTPRIHVPHTSLATEIDSEEITRSYDSQPDQAFRDVVLGASASPSADLPPALTPVQAMPATTDPTPGAAVSPGAGQRKSRVWIWGTLFLLVLMNLFFLAERLGYAQYLFNRTPAGPLAGTAVSNRAAIGTFVSIPAGKFRMGDLSGQGHLNEAPVREVSLPAFRMMATEVTVGQFRRFIEAEAYLNPAWRDFPCEGAGIAGDAWAGSGYAQTDDHPAVCVNWHDAQAYAAWLSRITGRELRLPTEAEFEYALRAGTTTDFWWGDSLSTSPGAVCRDCADQPALSPLPVASLRPNTWDLYDIAGNVREWTCSAYARLDTPEAQRCAPTKPSETQIAVRAGSWDSLAEDLRSSSRSYSAPTRRENYKGFRLVEVISSPP